MSYHITYADETNDEHGLLIYERPNITSSEEDIDTYEIPGRDEKLTSRSGIYKTMKIDVILNYASKKAEEWGKLHREAVRWLRKKGDLILSDDTDVFYKVLYVEIGENARSNKRVGKLTASFICRPGVYFADGAEFADISEVATDISGSIYEVTNEWSKCNPVYKLTGAGYCDLTVNGNTMSVAVVGEMNVDTDLKIAYDADGTIDNTAVSGDYDKLILNEGENTIEITDGFNLEIQTNFRLV